MRHIRFIATLSVALCTLAFAGIAAAAAPDMERVEIDELNLAVIDCGSYSLDEHLFGHVILRTFTRDGEVVMTLNTIALTHTFTNPDTGESLTSPDVGADLFMIRPDGSGILAILGIVARVVVPGEGMVAAEIGRVELVFTDPNDTEPDVTVSGIHSGFDAVEEALCAALAPPA
jgi:hypothetical protein